jgi:hypothetical protein
LLRVDRDAGELRLIMFELWIIVECSVVNRPNKPILEPLCHFYVYKTSMFTGLIKTNDLVQRADP